MYWNLPIYHVTIAAPYPGGIDPRLAVYARSSDGHYTTTRRDRLDKTTSNRTMKSPPAKGHRKQTLTPSNCITSVHTAVQTILVSTKKVGSNSFGQRKIGQELCLPKTDSSKFTLSMKTQLTLFKTCNLYSRHRKVSIPSSLVSNNIKPRFHVIGPQLQHLSLQDRRLLWGHGCINHDIPNSQFSKTCKCAVP